VLKLVCTYTGRHPSNAPFVSPHVKGDRSGGKGVQHHARYRVLACMHLRSASFNVSEGVVRGGCGLPSMGHDR
jgi:hypothetical protein